MFNGKPLPNPDLELFTVDQLIDELVSRADAIAIGAVWSVPGSKPNTRLEFAGDPLFCIGIATLLGSKIAGTIGEEEP